MSLSGLFFQGTCWLHIPVYFLHFRRRPFNLLFFSMKVLKLFSEKTLWKWKLLYLVENQTRKINFLITKILRKIYYTYFFEMTVCLNFHKKDSGTHSFRFFERRLAIFSILLTFFLNVKNLLDTFYFSLQHILLQL